MTFAGVLKTLAHALAASSTTGTAVVATTDCGIEGVVVPAVVAGLSAMFSALSQSTKR